MYLFRRSFYFHEKEGRAAEILGRPPIGSEVMGTGYGIIIKVVSKGLVPIACIHQNGFGCWICFHTWTRTPSRYTVHTKTWPRRKVLSYSNATRDRKIVFPAYLANIGVTKSALYHCDRSAPGIRNVLRACQPPGLRVPQEQDLDLR